MSLLLAIRKDLLLYAGTALHQLANELHQSRAEHRVLLHPVDRGCHHVDVGHHVVGVDHHVAAGAGLRGLWISSDWVVQLGEEGEEYLRFVLVSGKGTFPQLYFFVFIWSVALMLFSRRYFHPQGSHLDAPNRVESGVN